MSQNLLGLPFDIHTGGVDLRFPHHEDELAQCTAGYHVHDQASFWMHNEFLEVEGKKMSKSLGNFYTLRDLIARGIEPIDVRFAMLQAHYRAVFNFTFDGVTAARTARAKVQDYVYDVVDVAGSLHASASDGVGQKLIDTVGQALADDVHTPRALAALFVYMNEHPARTLTPADAASVVDALRVVNEVFAVIAIEERPTLVVPDHIRALAEERWAARTAKNWSESDRLREMLSASGWTMKDGKDGYTLESTK
jgi:cysteinyl-tRNA synthetase